ncbi:hypothetical protein [Terricaulis sp.]|uniref:hypothetical protein n=1 Tax=Terricaulis sp. TaxID=2768686 RepID=UPI003783584B
MRGWILAVALCVSAPLQAFAQDGAPANAYAVPTETIQSGGARAGFMETGSSAGGYSWISRSSAASSNVFGRQRQTTTATFHFDRGEANVLRGACRMRSEGTSMFGVQWNQRTTQLYTCEMRDQAPAQYALEVAVPAFNQGGFSIGGFSVSAERDIDAGMQAILHARMVYNGVAYEASPIGFARESIAVRRVVTGYAISRDGHPVGRIEFHGNSSNQSTIVLPSAETDGREAVLFMSLTLQAMPDVYSSTGRDAVMPH